MSTDPTPTDRGNAKKRLQVVERAVQSFPVRPDVPEPATDKPSVAPDGPKPVARPRRRPGTPATVPAGDQRRPADRPARGKVRKPAKGRTVLTSFLVMVALPAVLAAAYFWLIAADQYHAEARFAVRGTEAPPTDIMGLVTGTPSGMSNTADSVIVQQYILSREMVETVGQTVNLEEVYNRPEADFLAGLGHDKPIEEVVEYWQDMVSAQFDSYSGIVTLEVRAFRPDDALIIANAIVRESDSLVNRLAAKARSDAISFAQRELELAEWRLQDARRAVIEFQSSSSTFDPAAAAQANMELVNRLRGQVAEAQSELAGLMTFVDPQAPSVRVLKTRIAALEQQIESEQRKIGNDGTTEESAGDGRGLSDQVADFQELKTKEHFAEQVYTTSLASLEQARANAKRTHSYLATFVNPMPAQQAIYPERIGDTLLVIAIAFAVWAIGGLMYAAIRDHVS